VDHSPEFIYFKTLFHVFEKFLSGQEEQAQFFDNTAITDTEIWKALFEFQKDGVKGPFKKSTPTTAASWPTAWVWVKPIRRCRHQIL
jgi:hypothetical protein